MLIACILISVAPPAAPAPTFNSDVLPILSNNCFVCHGPDKGSRQAGLRLDTPDGGLADGLILPTDTHASALLNRITATDTKHRMPPANSGKQLTDDEIDTLRRWIEAGAPYESHWAFAAPQPVTVPPGDVWCRTPIDAFIKTRLDAEGLTPNTDANRHTLIRRVTLDLTGLPPTPDQVHAFVNDDGDDQLAYERLVDSLLASPQFGEHAARPWLDLARYADSQGFEKDNLRVMWRYRDWVIDAFNADMPFDQFTREQIAGDLLPNATLEQRIATGFHRNTQTNTEGGTDNEEFRSGAVIDRVNTTMQGWMGITAGCAQCHDHKFDPLSQQAYFELYAFFNQTADADLDNDAPFIKAPSPVQQADLDQHDTDRAALDARLQQPDAHMQAALSQWLETRCDPAHWQRTHPLAVAATNGTTYDVKDDATILAQGPDRATEQTAVTLRTDLVDITGVKLTTLARGEGPGRAGHRNFVLNDITLSTNAQPEPVHFAFAQATFNQPDFNVLEAIDDDTTAKSGWAIAGGFDEDQIAVFALAEPLTVPDDGLITVHLAQQYDFHGLGQFQLSLTDHDTPRLPLSNTSAAAAAVPTAERSSEHWQTLAMEALPTAPAFQGLRDEDAALREYHTQLQADVPTALVMEALPAEMARTTELFLGGTFLAPDHERGPLHPGVPEVLHPLQANTPTRLDLASWLTQADNPLTARVQVNRAWERLFGNGLVATVDNFGVQGERPSHAALLDWLALHWQHDLKWSHKALLKAMVMSSVYRQSARIEPEVLRRDPRNRLLSHAPRLRLSAEQLRDTALAAAGLLKIDRMGGPSVMPRLPDGMLPQAFTSFVQAESTGDNLYRRGLYTQWRRTGHYPTFATFDAPSRELCMMTRERSNTPLQALAMLNDDVFVEAAQGLARRAMADTRDPISAAFEFALARTPTEQEYAILKQIHDQAIASGNIDRTLATEPIGPLPEGMDPKHAVAMTVTCNVILNLDEFINRP